MELILNMTIGGTVAGLIILLLKRLLKNKLTPRWHCLIWIILAVRLVIPVLPESGFSIMNFVPPLQNLSMTAPAGERDAGEKSVTEITAGGKTGLENRIEALEPVTDRVQANPELSIEQTVKSGSDHRGSIGFTSLIFYLWLAGAALTATFFGVSYAMIARSLQRMPLCQDADILELFEDCKKTAGLEETKIFLRIGGEVPMLHGILSPTVIIPKGYSKEELSHVMIHEVCHYKHKDLLINVFSCLLLSLYWYNPVLWICFFNLRCDLEVLCDETVIGLTGRRKEYAETLLKTAARKNQAFFAVASMQNGEREVSRRIKLIASFQRPKAWISGLAIIAVLTTGAFCLTDAQTPKPWAYQPDGTYSGEWGVTAEKLLNAYFKSYVRAELPVTTDINGYRIEGIKPYEGGEGTWRLTNFSSFHDVMLYSVDYTLYAAYPGLYDVQGSGFVVGEEKTLLGAERKTIAYKDQLAVFNLDGQGTPRFLGFVDQDARDGTGEAFALHSMIKTMLPDQSSEFYSLKTPYIGDASKVGRIVQKLPLNQYINGIQLHTKEEPYGLTVSYDLTHFGGMLYDESGARASTDSRGWDPNPYIKEQLFQNSAMLLSLIDNCSTVELVINGMLESGAPYTYHFWLDKQVLEQELGMNLEKQTSSPEEYRVFFERLDERYLKQFEHE